MLSMGNGKRWNQSSNMTQGERQVWAVLPLFEICTESVHALRSIE